MSGSRRRNQLHRRANIYPLGLRSTKRPHTDNWEPVFHRVQNSCKDIPRAVSVSIGAGSSSSRDTCNQERVRSNDQNRSNSSRRYPAAPRRQRAQFKHGFLQVARFPHTAAGIKRQWRCSAAVSRSLLWSTALGYRQQGPGCNPYSKQEPKWEMVGWGGGWFGSQGPQGV